MILITMKISHSKAMMITGIKKEMILACKSVYIMKLYLLMNRIFNRNPFWIGKDYWKKEVFFFFADSNMVKFRKCSGIGLCANTNGWNNWFLFLGALIAPFFMVFTFISHIFIYQLINIRRIPWTMIILCFINFQKGIQKII